MLFYFKEIIDPSVLAEMGEKAFLKLQAEAEPFAVRCYGELLAEIGYATPEVCEFVAEAMLAERMDFALGILMLSNFSHMGLQFLVELANHEIPHLSSSILNELSKS